MANTKKPLLASLMGQTTLVRGVSAILIFLIIWQIGALFDDWFGIDILAIGLVPPPTDVFVAFLEVIPKIGYWQSWVASFSRVLPGFVVAMIIGIPFGLLLAVNRYFRGIFFPPFEILRPIPTLAWVPASLIFWLWIMTALLPISLTTVSRRASRVLPLYLLIIMRQYLL